MVSQYPYLWGGVSGKKNRNLTRLELVYFNIDEVISSYIVHLLKIKAYETVSTFSCSCYDGYKSFCAK